MSGECYSQRFMCANICATPLQMQDILIKRVLHCEAYHGYGIVLIGLSDCTSSCNHVL